jgi:transcriptional regulator of acetoin/glycerol metabolism
LENTIEHAVAMSNSTMIELEDLPPEIRQQEINSSLLKNETEQKRTLEDLEKIQILKILSDVNFNKSRAAEILGIDRTTLYRKAQKYGIELKEK